MDFGNILDNWENQKHKITEDKPKKKSKTDILNSWMRINGIYDKDAAEANEPDSPQEKRRRLRMKKPDAVLDIHGMTRDEAWLALEYFFADSKKKNFEKIIVIHGKGNHSAGEAVLKRMVMDFIEHCTCAGESGKEKTSAGGEGATWVIIK